MSVEAAEAAVGASKDFPSDDVYEPPRALSESTDVSDLDPEEFSVENIERIYRSVNSLYNPGAGSLKPNLVGQQIGLAHYPCLLGSLLYVLGHPLQCRFGADHEHGYRS